MAGCICSSAACRVCSQLSQPGKEYLNYRQGSQALGPCQAGHPELAWSDWAFQSSSKAWAVKRDGAVLAQPRGACWKTPSSNLCLPSRTGRAQLSSQGQAGTALPCPGVPVLSQNEPGASLGWAELGTEAGEPWGSAGDALGRDTAPLASAGSSQTPFGSQEQSDLCCHHPAHNSQVMLHPGFHSTGGLGWAGAVEIPRMAGAGRI